MVVGRCVRCQSVSVLIFVTRVMWLAQILLVVLVVRVVFAARGFLVVGLRWALLTVALATESNSVRNTAVLGIVIMLSVTSGSSPHCGRVVARRSPT
jgi:hypothetical protein